jgi:hypothetical protein
MNYAAFDIETAPRDEAIAYLPAPDPEPEPGPEPEADKRLTDPVKIAADLEKKRAKAAADLEQRREEAIRKRAERINRLSLDMNGCRIVALGWQDETLTEPAVLLESVTEEREMLAAFWIQARGRTLVGFRSRTFDLPVIIQRSRLLGVPIPPWRDLLAPYGRAKRHIDLYDEATFDASRTDNVLPRGLHDWGAPHLFDTGIPKDDCGGAEIAALVAAKDYVAIGLHCCRDVARTVALARALGVIPAAVAVKQLQIESAF